MEKEIEFFATYSSILILISLMYMVLPFLYIIFESIKIRKLKRIENKIDKYNQEKIEMLKQIEIRVEDIRTKNI